MMSALYPYVHTIASGMSCGRYSFGQNGRGSKILVWGGDVSESLEPLPVFFDRNGKISENFLFFVSGGSV